eukprot:11215813-Alexandrium_andersonii.AAC.1
MRVLCCCSAGLLRPGCSALCCERCLVPPAARPPHTASAAAVSSLACCRPYMVAAWLRSGSLRRRACRPGAGHPRRREPPFVGPRHPRACVLQQAAACCGRRVALGPSAGAVA